MMATSIEKQSTSDYVYRSTCAGFPDDRIFLVAPDDERLAIYSDPDAPTAHLQQSFDGPGYLAVGPNVTDSSLDKVSARFGIRIEDLVEFRRLMKAKYST